MFPPFISYISSSDHRDLHSFPTRRSSDLGSAQNLDRVVTLYRAARRCSIQGHDQDRKSTRLNSSHVETSYAVFCLKKKTRLTLYGDSNSIVLPRIILEIYCASPSLQFSSI